MSGELPKADVIRKSITNPETGGSLDVIYKKNTTLHTLGHILAIPTHLVFGRLQDVGVDPDPKLVDKILTHWKDVPWKGDVTVRIGAIDPQADWKRTVEQMRKEGKSNVFTEAIGFVNTYIADWKGTLTRSSFYNSWTKTAHIYHPDIAVAFHELGHAQNLEGSPKMSGLFKTLRGEWMASKHAMEHGVTDAQRREAIKMLEPAFGTYIAKTASNTVLLGGLAGLMVSEFNKPKSISFYENKAPAFVAAFFGLKIIPVALAHLFARLPNRKSSFGYVFSGEAGSGPARDGNAPEQTLKPHQVLVATAKAKG